MARKDDPVRITKPMNYELLIGRCVEVIGIVRNTKCPQIYGIDLWELEDFREKKMLVIGTLKKTVVTQKDIDSQPMAANRGAGTFYSLEDIHYEQVP